MTRGPSTIGQPTAARYTAFATPEWAGYVVGGPSTPIPRGTRVLSQILSGGPGRRGAWRGRLAVSGQRRVADRPRRLLARRRPGAAGRTARPR